MSNADTIKFYVNQDVLDTGLKIVYVVMKDIDNTKENEEWKQKREDIIQKLLKEYENLDYHSDPVLEGFHILHDHSGVKRRKNIPASENLIRALRKHGDVPFINQVVDLYNIISMKSKLALGAHDIDHVDGNVTLRFTDGSEKFVPIGLNEPVPVNPHEYCYCDDSNEVLCRLEIRQVEKTKVDTSTKNLFYIVQGNEAVSDEYLKETAQRSIEETERYCGGTGKIVYPEIL